MPNIRSAIGLLWALALPSCFGGQTGGEVRVGDPGQVDNGWGCKETATDLGLDALSPLGFSATQILDMAGGARRAKLVWHPKNGLQFGPESGESDLEIVVSHVGGQVRYLDSEPETEPAKGMVPPSCADWLEVDVDVAFRTAGGAFDEHFAGRLSSHTAEQTSMQLALWPAQLQGTFHAEPTDRDAQLKLTFRALFLKDAAVGYIDALLEKHEGNTASGSMSHLADWGSGDCEVGEAPVALDAYKASVEQILSTIDAHSPMTLRWQDGAVSHLSLHPELVGTQVCRTLMSVAGNPVGSLRMRTSIDARSDDGRIAKEYPAWVLGGRWEDAPSFVRFGAISMGVVSKTDFLNTYGIANVNFGTRAWADTSLLVSYSPESGNANGRLEIWSPDEVPCSNDPQTSCLAPTGVMLDGAILEYP